MHPSLLRLEKSFVSVAVGLTKMYYTKNLTTRTTQGIYLTLIGKNS